MIRRLLLILEALVATAVAVAASAGPAWADMASPPAEPPALTPTTILLVAGFLIVLAAVTRLALARVLRALPSRRRGERPGGGPR